MISLVRDPSIVVREVSERRASCVRDFTSSFRKTLRSRATVESGKSPLYELTMRQFAASCARVN